MGVLATLAPMNTQPDAPFIESAALVQIAKEARYHVTERMLETFRTQGLMPPLARVGNRGRSPIWASPLASEQQLLSLMRWREYTTDRDALLVLLWLGGNDINLELVRQAVLASLEKAEALIDDELRQRAQELGVDPESESGRDQAIDKMAAELARKKEMNTVLPRRAGGSHEERVAAIANMTKAFLGNAPTGSESEAAALEATLGISKGRDHSAGMPAWITGPASELFETLGEINLAVLRDATMDASPEEWEAARPVADALVRFLPVLFAMAKALAGEENPAGLGLLGGLGDRPESALLIVPLVIHMLRLQPSETRQVSAALGMTAALAPEMEKMLDVPEYRIQALPPAFAKRAGRLVDTYLDGELTPAPERPSKKKPGSRRA